MNARKEPRVGAPRRAEGYADFEVRFRVVGS